MASSAAAAGGAASASEEPKAADEVAAELERSEIELRRPQRLAQMVYEVSLPDSAVPAADKARLREAILEDIKARGACDASSGDA